ncbi:MFS general substrate transporter [Annulohypoxylon truncatum]|uniref:MFS general substrate transporter n=1 Tax=Annulohypoxylon truncatum TaxID=327061 RepID=UPI002007BBD1|nr:MFS general substrate transporter [Annulohypoxylon truncatum]KAI1206701.1 MFS general substrate transporter [Annulohypoxylon truncatum]
MARKQHLVRSHAHEEDIPGTVNVQAVEGDDAYYGQALFPVPAEDPNDPLQWSRAKKITILVIMCGYSFLGNSALLGPGPYLTLWSEVFDISPGDASTLISYPNLAYGFSSLLLVPLYLKFGRRPVMLGSMLAFIAGLIGSACANNFAALMAWRVISSFGAGICEALPVQLVSDIFFLHERGKHIGYYTFGMCFAAVATIPAAYMLPTKYSWRLFFYVMLAFAIALFILAFLFVEETCYDREAHRSHNTSPERSDEIASNGSEKPDEDTVERTTSIPKRKSFLMTLRLWGYVDPEVNIFTLMWRSFTYFLVPQVLWVVTSFGTIIGLGALAFNFVFPIKITAPPYNWPESSSGVQSLGSLLGFLLALPFTSTSDRLAAYLTRRNHGIREAEMRLGVMLPAMIIGPAGLVVYGLTAQFNLHWIGYFFGSGLSSFGGYFYYCFTLAYAVDSYNSNTSEMLIAINVGKQAVSFGLGFGVLDWVLERGYGVIIAGVFGAVFLANNLALILFMFRGKQIRRFMSTSWLAKLHGRANGHESHTL